MFFILFQLTEKMREKVHYGPEKIAFRPFMFLKAEGIGLDIIMKGLTFFNVQFGISNISLETRGNCICGADDGEDQRVYVYSIQIKGCSTGFDMHIYFRN